MSSMSVIAR